MDAERPAIDRVIEAAQEHVEGSLRVVFDGFARTLLRGLERHPAGGESALARLAADAFAFAARREPGQIAVRVENPSDRPGHTLVQLLQDDRPFIVDSLRMFLQRHGLRERIFLHPILPAQRAADGCLERLGTRGVARAESLVYAEVVPRVEDAGRLGELAGALRELMDTVDRKSVV